MNMKKLIHPIRVPMEVVLCAGILALHAGPARADSWLAAPPMPTPRLLLAAATGPDGTLYAIGGGDNPISPHGLNVVEVFNASTRQWNAAPPMPTARYGLAAATDADGNIYAFGGTDSLRGTIFATAELFNPSTRSWATIGPMPTPRLYLAGATGPDGSIYALGGVSTTGTLLDRVEVYHPSAFSWSTVAPMPTARGSLAAAFGSDGRLYAMGGFNESSSQLNTVEAYDPATDTWSTVSPMPTARRDLAAAAIVVSGIDRIFALGGHGSEFPLTTVEIYSP